jgi:putative ABC transport system permease protein
VTLINGWGVVASLSLVLVAIATVRAIVQLLAVGVILVPVLNDDAPMYWTWVALTIAISVVVVRRRTAKFNELRPTVTTTTLAVAAPLAVSLGVVFGFGVLELAPFALIPVSGILLGNTLPATVSGAVRFQEQVTSERGQIEAMLALGMPPKEAIRSKQCSPRSW